MLPRRVGLHRAKELTLLADIIDAAGGRPHRARQPRRARRRARRRSSTTGPPASPPGRRSPWPRPSGCSTTRVGITLEQALDDEGAAQTVNFATADTAEAVRRSSTSATPTFQRSLSDRPSDDAATVAYAGVPCRSLGWPRPAAWRTGSSWRPPPAPAASAPARPIRPPPSLRRRRRPPAQDEPPDTGAGGGRRRGTPVAGRRPDRMRLPRRCPTSCSSARCSRPGRRRAADRTENETARFRVDQARAGVDRALRLRRGRRRPLRHRHEVPRDGRRSTSSAPASTRRPASLVVEGPRSRSRSFGGDEVIGAAESDVNCPVLDDPVRTHARRRHAGRRRRDQPADRRQARHAARRCCCPSAIAFAVVFGLVAAALADHRRRQGASAPSSRTAAASQREVARPRLRDAGPTRPSGPGRSLVERGRRSAEAPRPSASMGDLLGRAVGPAAHEHAADDRLVEQPAEGEAVGGELVAVAGDARRLVGAGAPLVGLVVDDDEARRACARAGRCSPRAPCSPSSATTNSSRQCSAPPAAAATIGAASAERHSVGDPLPRARRCPPPRTAPRRARRCRRRWRGRRPAARRARPGRPPCRSGRAATAAGRGRRRPWPVRRRRCRRRRSAAPPSASSPAIAVGQPRWRWSPSAPTPRPIARARSALPLGDVGPRQLERVGRRSARAASAAPSSGVGAVAERRRASASTVALGRLRRAVGVDVLGLAVQRHDEVVDGAGAGDVQQAAALGVAHLLVERLDTPRTARCPARRAPSCRPATRPTAPRWPLHLGGQPADDRDRELQALGGVHRHDPHGVVVALGQDRVAGPALGRLVRGPAQVAPHAPPAGVGPRPGLVDDVAHAPPHVAGVGPAERASRARAARRRCGRAARRASTGRRRAAIDATWAMRRGDRVVGHRRRAAAANSRQRPPAVRQSYSSTSLQPYSGERRAATRASSSVGSAAARSASIRSRISGAT